MLDDRAESFCCHFEGLVEEEVVLKEGWLEEDEESLMFRAFPTKTSRGFQIPGRHFA